MINDPLLDLSEALAAQLQGSLPTFSIGSTEYPVSVAWTCDGEITLDDSRLAAPLITVHGYGETSESKDGDTPEDLVVLVVAQMKAPSDQTPADVYRAMSGLMASLKNYLRPGDNDTCDVFVGTDCYSCVKTERTPAVDPEEWQRNKLFYSMISATFRIYR
jgi:hypothetical protein